MTKQHNVKVVAFLLVVLAFFVMFEQYLIWNNWWDWSQFLHHESFAFGLVAISFGMIVAMMMLSKKRGPHR